MAAPKITWPNQQNASLSGLPQEVVDRINNTPADQKFSADEINQVKTVVNAHADQLDALLARVAALENGNTDPPELEPVATVLISGQSPALGTGELSVFDFAPYDAVDVRRPFERTRIWNPDTQALEALEPPLNNQAATDGLVAGQPRPASFGVESIIAPLWEADNPIGALHELKISGDGQPISLWADPESGRLLEIRQGYAGLKAALAAQGKAPRTDAFFWLHGQSDQAAPDGYAEKFATLVAYLLEQDIIQPATRIIVVAVDPEGVLNGADGVAMHAEQESYVDSNDNARLVEQGDLPTYDGLHLTGMGYIKLGERCYNAAYDTAATLVAEIPDGALPPGTYQEDDSHIAYVGNWISTNGQNGASDAANNAKFLVPGAEGSATVVLNWPAGSRLALDHLRAGIGIHYKVNITGLAEAIVVVAPGASEPFAERFLSAPLPAPPQTVVISNASGYCYIDQLRYVPAS